MAARRNPYPDRHVCGPLASSHGSDTEIGRPSRLREFQEYESSFARFSSPPTVLSLDAASDPSGSSPARFAKALPWLPMTSGTWPPLIAARCFWSTSIKQSTQNVHAAVPEPKATKKLRNRVRELTSSRNSEPESRAYHRRTDDRTSRLGELFPHGECRPVVEQDGLLRGEERVSLAVPGRPEATKRAPFTGDQLYGLLEEHREIPGKPHQKIIVKRVPNTAPTA